MADRYWVGGTATWDATAGTKWSTTSGGAGGAAVPTAADDVFFDANSGVVTCTVTSANTGAKSINFTGFTGTFAGSGAMTVAGSLTFVAGMTVTYTGRWTFSASATITSAGKTISGAGGGVTVDGALITVQLADALNVGNGRININQGTFTTNDYNITAGDWTNNVSFVQTINLGSSTFTLSSNFPTFLVGNANLTLNAGTSTVVLTGSAARLNNSGSLPITLANVNYTNTTVDTRAVIGLHSFSNLTVAGPASAGVVQFTFSSRQTINGTLSTTGTAGNRRVWFRSSTYGIAQTLTINATPSLTDADFRDIYVIGTSAPISGTRIGNLRGCRGITFDAAKTVYWNLAGAQNWSADGWSDTQTGTPNTNFFPLAQDTATFTNSGSVTGTITMNSAVPYTGTVDMSGRTSAMTLSVTAFTIYGDWKNGSGTTLSGSGTLTFSGRNTQTITSAGKTFSGGITVDSYGGTVELADALNIGVRTLDITNGTFDTKNYNVVGSTLSSNTSNVRSITLGSSTLTLDSNPVSFVTSNLTFNAGTSSFVCSSSAAVFNGGSQSFYDVSFTSTSTGTTTINGANTFNNLSITAPASAGLRQVSFSANQTINGTLTVAGDSPVRRIFVQSNTLGTTRTLTVNTLAATDCDFRDITIAGTAAGSSPTRAGDCGGNSGITFPAPKTVYWNLAGAQSWSATAWAPGTGGTPDINNFPLAQDTAVFDEAANSVTGTITINQPWNIGTFDASARTSAMTLAYGASLIPIYGNLLVGTGVTFSSSNTTQKFVFSGRSTQTITSNGISIRQFDISGVNNIVQLADAVDTTNGGITLTSGTFDAVSYNVTAAQFTNSATTTIIKMGSGTWTLSSSGDPWSMTSAPAAFYKGTANIVLSGTGSITRNFRGAGLSYNKLTIGGATGTSTLRIFGDNQFTELASTKPVAHTIALDFSAQTFGKWTVTGSAGNVVTLTGTGTSHVLAGACTSGIDYLAIGDIRFAATSPGEFYAGANSTATGVPAAPTYLTAKPADSTRYWVGGTGNWSDTARWSTSSGGGSGAAVPRSHDDVVFDSGSNATAYTATVNAVTGGIRMKSLTIAGPASGNVTLAGSTAMVGIHGNVTLPATGLTRTYTGAITLSSNSTGLTFTTNGVTLASAITVNGVDCAWALGSALDMGTSALTVTNGSFDLATYNLTAGLISSDNGNSRTIDFGTGTTTLSGSTPLTFGATETNRANITVTASTSQINCSATSPIFSGNNQTFYNVSFTSTSAGTVTLNGANSFNNLSFTGSAAVGLKNIVLSANQTVTGTLTFSAGTNATMRHFVRSDTIGTTRTITTAAFSGTDVDFRDITIAGGAAPVSGTRLGDAKGNSGITFDAGKTVYVRSTGSANWSSSTGWSATEGSAADVTQFPLAQDTVIFPAATYPASGSTITVDQSYNIGTIDMSLRTSNTVTLATGSTTPGIYGNWINGTGTTLSGTNTMTFAGRGSQTITSAGKTFTQTIAVDSPGGSVTLVDAFTASQSSASVLTITRGTFDAATYNVTLSGAASGVSSSNSNTRTIAIGSGTWAISGTTSAWATSTSTNLTVTGTGTISLTSASAKTFAGGGAAYTDITLNQGGNGALTITGNNTFKEISSTATGATNITLGTTTQTITTSWTAAGTAGNILTVQGTSASSPGTLIYTGSGDAANVDYLTITGVRAYPL